jgi:hypothetical protein
MLNSRRFLLPSIVLLIALAASARAAGPARFAGHWTLVVDGKSSKDLTIEQTGNKLDGVIKEDWGYVNFKGSTSGKKSFQLESVGKQDREIRIVGSIDEDGMLSGTITIEDSLSADEDHLHKSAPKTAPWIALRKE